MDTQIRDEVQSTSWSTISIYSSDPVLNWNTVPSEMSDVSPNNYNVFDDELFNGKSYVLTFDVDMYNTSNVKSLDDYSVDVQAISKSMYLYYKTLDAQQWYGDSPFSEPVQLHTNVDGGAGIVGGLTSNLLKLEPAVVLPIN